MTIRTTLLTSTLIAASLVSGAAQAALQGRDLNGSIGSFEAYYDTDLDITWLANANYGAGSVYDDYTSTTDGKMTWASAKTWATNLSFTDGVNVYDNWRLPTTSPINGSTFNYSSTKYGGTDLGYNISAQGTAYAGSTASEMAHMFYNTLGNPSYYALTGWLSGCYVSASDTCLDNVGPFSNLQPFTYWSSTEYAPNIGYAWSFSMSHGGQGPSSETTAAYYAWAVSPGDVGAVPEPEAWVMLLAGLGLVGVATRRRRG